MLPAEWRDICKKYGWYSVVWGDAMSNAQDPPLNTTILLGQPPAPLTPPPKHTSTHNWTPSTVKFEKEYSQKRTPEKVAVFLPEEMLFSQRHNSSDINDWFCCDLKGMKFEFYQNQQSTTSDWQLTNTLQTSYWQLTQLQRFQMKDSHWPTW